MFRLKAVGQSIMVGVVVALLLGGLALADTTPIHLRQLNTLWRDAATVDTPTYGMLMSGWDGTNPQFISTNVSGQLIVTLGTALDSTNDSVTAVGQFVDGGTGFTQETSRVVAIGGLFDDTAGTALTENDIAALRINSLRALVITQVQVATTCTALSNTALSTTSEVVFAASTTRRKMCISNNDASIAIHVRFGATATTASTRVPAGATICEEPANGYIYQGTIDAIAASGTPAISGEECTG